MKISKHFSAMIEQQETSENIQVDGDDVLIVIAKCKNDPDDLELHIRELDMASLDQRKHLAFYLMAATDIVVNSIQDDENQTVN